MKQRYCCSPPCLCLRKTCTLFSSQSISKDDCRFCALNVLQELMLPVSKPRLNHVTRCAEVPSLNESGVTYPLTVSVNGHPQSCSKRLAPLLRHPVQEYFSPFAHDLPKCRRSNQLTQYPFAQKCLTQYRFFSSI